MTDRHILICNVFFAPNTYGGATIVAEEVARALRRQTGWRVSALSLWARDDLLPYSATRCHADGIDSYLIALPPHRRAVEAYANPQVTEVLGGLVDTLAPDLLHVHCVQDMGAGVIETAATRDIPVVLSVHDYWWVCPRQFMIRPDQTFCGQSPIDPRACRACVPSMSGLRTRQGVLMRQAAMAGIVTYPSHFALDLCETSGLAPGRGVVWQNGVHPPGPTFFADQKARRAADPRLSFGYLGGPARLKGWHDIRAAFSGLERGDFRVTLVDGSTDASWWTDHRFDDLPGDWQVRPRFGQNDMDSVYAGIDVLLFPSQWKETFGLAIREALARGIQVIQTDSGGTTEHAGRDHMRLIPIGAGPGPLREQIEAALEIGQTIRAPIPVTRFDDQAAEFAHFARALWGGADGKVSPRPAPARPATRRDSRDTAA